MKRITVILLICALLTVVLVSIGYYGVGSMKAVAEQQHNKYVCPMHPEVVSDTPGKCPKCGMNLVVREDKAAGSEKQVKSVGGSVDDKVDQARTLLDGAKKELAHEGKYKCCIMPKCDECLLGHQNCLCATNLKAGKGVCSQCYGGWQRGDGDVDGVDAGKVKGDFHGHGHGHGQ
jgi:hypothetical protein